MRQGSIGERWTVERSRVREQAVNGYPALLAVFAALLTVVVLTS